MDSEDNKRKDVKNIFTTLKLELTISIEESKDFINLLSQIGEEKLSKYQACKLVKCSRATFDNLIRAGKLPNGKRQIGFKEKFWNKKEILKYVATHK